MLEFDDIQHILLTRTSCDHRDATSSCRSTRPQAAARGCRAARQVAVRGGVQATMDSSDRWVTLAIHVEWPSRARRARGFAGDLPRRVSRGHGGPRGHSRRHRTQRSRTTGIGGLAGDDLHAIAILFSRATSSARAVDRGARQTARAVPTACGVCRILDLNATPPFNFAHDHFGFRDRLSQPVMKGSGEEPTPGSGAALEPGEFILGLSGRRWAGRESA